MIRKTLLLILSSLAIVSYAQCPASSTPTNDCTGGDQIEVLTLNSTTASGNNGCGTNGYNSFTSPVWSFSQAVNYSVYAETGLSSGYNEGMAIWIDLDGDNQFSASEMVYADAPSGTHSGYFNIPTGSSVIPGNNRKMRVMCAYEYMIAGGDACTDNLGGYGETEDYLVNVLAAPPCTLTPVAGSVNGPSTLAVGAVGQYTVTPLTGSAQWLVSTSPTGPWNAVPGATTSVQPLSASVAGTYYIRVVANGPGCVNDTTNLPFTLTVTFPGNDVCSAIPLSIGTSSVYYGLEGATAQPGEVAPPDTSCQSNYSWCNNTINNSVWFSFTAPASGYVSINSPGFDTQLALWKANTCADLLSAPSATMLAANDDDSLYVTHGGVKYSSYIQAACLTPGATYYIQLDSYSPASNNNGDTTQIIITDMGSLNTAFTGLSPVYCLPGASSTTLSSVIPGGIFTTNTSSMGINSFDPAAVGPGTYTVTNTLFGCQSHSVTSVGTSPTVTASSSATVLCSGQSASLTASGATGYTWFPGSISGAGIVVSPTVTITYTVIGTSDVCSDTDYVNETVSVCTSIEAHGNNPYIRVYPNPCGNLLHIAVPADMTENTSISIFDTMGRLVSEQKLNATETTLDLTALNPGLYTYKIMSQQRQAGIGKLVKQ